MSSSFIPASIIPVDAYPKTAVSIGERQRSSKTGRETARISPSISNVRVSGRISHIFEPNAGGSTDFRTIDIEICDTSIVYFKSIEDTVSDAFPQCEATQNVRPPYRGKGSHTLRVKMSTTGTSCKVYDTEGEKNTMGQIICISREDQTIKAGDFCSIMLSTSSVWFLKRSCGQCWYASSVLVWKNQKPSDSKEEPSPFDMM